MFKLSALAAIFEPDVTIVVTLVALPQTLLRFRCKCVFIKTEILCWKFL